MSEQATAETGPNYRVADQVLAKLYLDLVSSVGADQVRAATKRTLDRADGYFSIERPTVLEIQQAIEERMESEGLGGVLYEYVLSELAAYHRDELETRVVEALAVVVQEKEAALPDTERQRTLDYILGCGPLQPCLTDPQVTEVLVDGPNKIYVERRGKLEETPYRFRDVEHLMTMIHRILQPTGTRLDEANPMADARMPDWSVVNVVLPPISVVGPALTIRKFASRRLTWENLIEFGSVTEEALEFLRVCVRARLNIVVSGGTGSGKTTLLNLITELIPGDERVVTVEHRAELQPWGHLEHIVRLEGRAADREGKGEITMRDLVVNALRMRPDRIIASEVRGAEVLDMIRAMNTGHDGSLLNIHANNPRDAVARLETMAMMGDPMVPLRNLRQEMASAIDLIVQQVRMRDGSRKVVNITEVQGTEGEVIVMQDIFGFEQTGVDPDSGRVIGRLRATGIIPKFYTRIQEAGVDLPPSVFGHSGRAS